MWDVNRIRVNDKNAYLCMSVRASMRVCVCERASKREREKEKERGRRIRMQVGKLSRLVGVGLKIESQQKQNKTLKAKISFSSFRNKISGVSLHLLHLTWTGSEPWVFIFKSSSDPRDYLRQC